MCVGPLIPVSLPRNAQFLGGVSAPAKCVFCRSTSFILFFFFSNPGETVVTGCIDIKTRYFFMQDSSCPHLVTQTQAVRRNFDVLPSANVSLYCLLLKISVSRQSQLFFLVRAQFFFLSFFTRRFSVSTRSSLRCLPAFRCSVRYARRDDFAWKEV